MDFSMKRLRLFIFCILAFLICLLPSPARGQRVVDQIVALVNDDVITKSDLLWAIALDPKSPNPVGPVSSDLLRRMLDVVIEQRLVAQEAARIPTAEITQDEIGKKRSELIAGFGSEAAFRQRVESVGLTPERIDDLLRQRILIDRFIEFRFQSFVFVSQQEIERYYKEELVPNVQKAGQVPPSLEQVRDTITEILKQEKIGQELDRYLTTARQRADVVYLAEP
jgi:hypothetical protein